MTRETEKDEGRHGALRTAFLFAVFVIAVYGGTLFSRGVFVGRDLLAYNLPLEKSIHDAYARGRLPVWSPEISGGRPLLPNPNAGALYPVRILLSALPFPTAMRIFPVLHWALAGIGAMLLLRAIGASSSAAMIAAAAYAFSGVAVSEVFYPHIQPGLMLLPWLLWAAARPWSRPASRTLVLATLLALDFLAGDVFTAGRRSRRGRALDRGRGRGERPDPTRPGSRRGGRARRSSSRCRRSRRRRCGFPRPIGRSWA